MSRFPLTPAKRALRETTPSERALSESEPKEHALTAWGWPVNPFFSFRMSYTEIAAPGGRAQVKRRETRFEDGKLATESFEGEVEPQVFDQLMNQAREQFMQHTELMLRSMSWFVPGMRKPPGGRD